MGATNRTANYDLPQWIGTDKPTFLGDLNDAFGYAFTAYTFDSTASQIIS